VKELNKMLHNGIIQYDYETIICHRSL